MIPVELLNPKVQQETRDRKAEGFDAKEVPAYKITDQTYGQAEGRNFFPAEKESVIENQKREEVGTSFGKERGEGVLERQEKKEKNQEPAGDEVTHKTSSSFEKSTKERTVATSSRDPFSVLTISMVPRGIPLG